ncbi:MAG: alpha/beta hydrolase-fold protein [Planctomycetes bacterium]|nr:alpha/beta hydrolase-fold protein [Planctomycetota bacterium]
MEKSRNRVLLGIMALGLVVSAPGRSVAGAQRGMTQAETPAESQELRSAWIPAAGDPMKGGLWRLGTLQSKAAGAVVGYYYYLPPAYEADQDKHYPVIYWLHGLGGSPASANPVVTRLDAGIRAGTAPEVILISCTDPTKRSMWTDSKDGRVPVETVIVQDLIPHVDATFRTIATRQGRAIEGYSMGGYGAAYLGFKYPQVFGAVSILAGALHTPDSLNAKRSPIFQAAFGGDADYAQARSPWTLLRTNADAIRGRTFVRIHVGEKDPLREWNTRFHDLLSELRLEHTWFTVPNSTHNPAEFFANWPGNLFDFYRTAFAAARPRGEGVPPSDRGQDALATAAGPQAEEKVQESVYKKTPQGDLRIYVHFPAGWTAQDKRPAIVFFFGGGWSSGKVEQFEPQAKYLAQRGMVAARADYRVRTRHGTTPDKCVEDAKSAVRWLRANAAKFGIDAQRIVASGGSAGGHIAACTATVPGLEADGEDLSVSSRPNLLVLFNPVLDTIAIGEKYGMSEVGRKISPNHHLSKDLPPTVLFFGTEDRFTDGGKDFIAQTKALGLQTQMYLAPGQPHGFFNRSPWQERTTFLTDQFLTAHGYLDGKPTIALPPGGVALTKHEPAP